MTDDQPQAPRDAKPADDDSGPPKYIGWSGVLAIAVVAFVASYIKPFARLVEVALLGAAITALSGIACAVVCLAVGIRLKQVMIFDGGALLRFRIRGVWVGIGWVPLTAEVKPIGDDSRDPAADEPPPPPGSYPAAHWLARLTVSLAGPTAVLLVASLVDGPRLVWENFAEYPAQLYASVTAGAFPELMRGFFRFVDQPGWTATFGVMSAKMAASSLLPFSVTNGGHALGAIITGLTGWRPSIRTRTIAQVISILILLCAFLYTVYVYFYAWRDANG